jgi:polysaccharide biosynthesis transport protein
MMPGSPDAPGANGPEGLRQKDFEQKLNRARSHLAHKQSMVTNPQSHPEVVSLRAGLDRLVREHEAKTAEARKEYLAQARNRLKAEREEKAARLRTEIGLWAQREQMLAPEVQKLAERLGQGPNGKPDTPIPVDINLLAGELAQHKTMLENLSHRIKMLQLDVGSPPRVTTVQKATVPIQKEMKKQVGLTLAAALAGLALVLAGVTLYELAVGRVFGAPDLEGAVRAPILAALPPAGRRGPAARTGPAEGDRFTDAVDTLRTVLQKRLLTRHGQSLLVASAADGEGKSTVALHLALSLAQTSRRVLLIDADFRTPKLHAWVDAAAAPGLGEALVNERKLTEVLTRTAVPGLWFMPAGTWTAKIRQCLSQGQLRTMLSRLKEDYDYVVIDSHAVLSTLDTPLLAQHTDAVLFAVQKHGSRLAQVRKALQRLAEVGARKVGLLLVGEG